MATLADLIEFLLSLLRDPQARAEFDADPRASLAANGLESTSAQDVRDARLAIADDGTARPVSDARPPGGNDPVEEIRFTAATFEAEPAPPVLPESTFVTVDDSDTFIVQNNTLSDDDITIVSDSFNDQSSTDVVAIQADNSFNQGSDLPVVGTAADSTTSDLAPDAAPVVVNSPESGGVTGDSAADVLPPNENTFTIDPDDGTDPGGSDPDGDLIADVDVEPIEDAEADPTADAVVV
ncbi:IniB N-terminal domain-containing protein [Actinomycetes bacterium KLBMP 9759]